MIAVQRFQVDVKRALKKEWAKENSQARERAKAVAEVFCFYLRNMHVIAQSLVDYWMSEYIEGSSNPEGQPTEQSIVWLENMIYLFTEQIDQTNINILDTFSTKDWQEVHSLINAEAETLPIQTITFIMSIIVERKML
ncbi:MAG: hypothetical protein ACRC4W_08335 [Treponemataceae bacterium]